MLFKLCKLGAINSNHLSYLTIPYFPAAVNDFLLTEVAI